MAEIGRRFSLDKIHVDPSLKNKIFSADGDEHVGNWDGECIEELVKEINRIEERADPNYSSLPHRDNIPEDFTLTPRLLATIPCPPSCTIIPTTIPNHP